MKDLITNFLNEGREKGGFNNDDIVAIFAPLFERIALFHEEGFVAADNFIDLISIEDDVFYLPINAKSAPKINKQIHQSNSSKNYNPSLFVIEEFDEETIIGDSIKSKIESQLLQKKVTKEIVKAVFLPNYKSYEIEKEHHDPVTDIFLLGLLIASFALNRDLSDPEVLEGFVANQNNPSALNGNIHPTIASLITNMTALDRNKRLKDLNEITAKLINYRSFNTELQEDLSYIITAKTDRQFLLLQKLRTRLFDLSRRNKMLYYKSSSKLLNLTFASFPMVLNLKYVRPDSLMIWNEKLATLVKKQKAISLQKFIRFEENPYINASLNKIRLESNRDKAEYGFSQLKLVAVFLHWFNFKENAEELVSSPLIFIPVNLVKKKGIKDNFQMQITDSVAEINPILQYQLKELYNINLPDTIDFETEKIEDLYTDLNQQIKNHQSNIHLEFIDKPKIKVIHSKARQILNQFKRRQKNNRHFNHHFDLEYSYKEDQFKPLGLEMFKNYVESKQSSLEFLTSEINPDIVENKFSDTIDKATYYIQGASQNKYTWQFDLCHVVLGNFNYKKMTLVRDYNEIINKDLNSLLFSALFSPEPKALEENKEDKYAISDLYNIVQSDPSQDLAIINARANNSYLIQGPPGTGKSQTITNLIADFVARGKKVLFVCEKRAALDVVYQRLEQHQLEDLCCLIHDSQVDKKSFVQDLKKNYEQNLKETLDFNQLEKERNLLILNINKELDNIEGFHKHMLSNAIDCESSVRDLLEEIIHLKNHVPGEVSSSNFELLPSYKNWENYGKKIQELYALLEKQNFKASFKNHPISLYNKSAIESKIPLEDLLHKLNIILSQAEELEERLDLLQFEDSMENNLEIVIQSAEKISNLLYFSKQDLLTLLDAKSTKFRLLLTEEKEIHKIKKDLGKTEEKNKNWKTKLSEQDCLNALQIAKEKEGKLFSFFSSKYRAVKKSLKVAYDFESHQIKPSYTQVLLLLNAEYKEQNNLSKKKELLLEKYGGLEIQDLITTCENWHKNTEDVILKWFVSQAENKSKINDLSIFLEKLAHFKEEAKLIDWQYSKDFLSLQNRVTKLLKNIQDYSFFLPYLTELYREDNDLISILKNKDWKSKEIEAALVYRSLQSYLNQHKDLQHITNETIQFYTKKLKTFMNNFMLCNSLYIKAKQNEVFNEKIRFSELSTVGMDDTEKEKKKSYLEGRKILENEFGKSMRYKSIRVLASDESGDLIRELKPVWLMSPLSVSDTLPIQNDFFDVVIYDEASQITLEEGIPPLFRAPQTIIVGDKMQMPPSNFFNKKNEEEEDVEDLLMDQVDSLLDQGSRKLPSVMLKWHYRSRHETLIGYSNAAFYENQLLTIPDVYDLKQEFKPIEANGKEMAAFNYQEILKRPISYHYMTNGLYANRTNESEAQYIAELVKHLLLSKNKLSIGLVAFSKEQQNEIENALNEVTFFDKSFEELLEEKSQKEPNFEDIFIKNLENVQGDERDIIIMSTCYGYNSKGKMRMNFGPINRKGGEKRLNVLFSRAKKHMVVVSSIKHSDITNEYNEGANYFKKYLHFAEEMSLGKEESGQLILNSMHFKKKDTSLQKKSNLIKDIAQEIRINGYQAEMFLGQSDFKCHIAAKKNKENQFFDLGIIIDDFEHYNNDHIHASYLLKPEILKAFGWKILPVFAKDWYENKTRVVQQIIHILEGKEMEIKEDLKIIKDLEKDFEADSYLLKKEKYYFTRLEVNEGSSKFWEIALHNQDLIIQYGRIGSEGQKLIKNYSSTAEAIEEKRKLIAQKEKKGYKKVLSS